VARSLSRSLARSLARSLTHHHPEFIEARERRVRKQPGDGKICRAGSSRFRGGPLRPSATFSCHFHRARSDYSPPTDAPCHVLVPIQLSMTILELMARVFFLTISRDGIPRSPLYRNRISSLIRSRRRWRVIARNRARKVPGHGKMSRIGQV